MISPLNSLQDARLLLLQSLSEEVLFDELRSDIYQLKVVLNSGIQLYFRYNEFNEYAYQIVFSAQKGDYARFDNYDDQWDVKTCPHHFHERDSKVVSSSPMIGIPSHDIPLLINYLKSGKI